ncbi:Carotenoid oxygenase [Methanohalobium evestigatum Z-7303]|uniref:Carotenoid oxygenase n=1 Tax=Methanohalobium evestigatum (strain ATCC BAA-1072 / DSM 3721 / NBRC 107634 / OCM 161 / Z-7303) TaxID=644295 RepID=D7E5X1_METEZ|nr:carotenoid oxygenase family protein [Methanohalobium evestigatum]ADI72993.1 Carotenoid oxygenase [Methanohalobium evestigatum Z-7303]
MDDSEPLDNTSFPSLDEQDTPSPLGLATSVDGEYSYEAEIEGTIPNDLKGTLYLNGPGLFDRGNLRKRYIFDGDGMIQSFHFHEGGVYYQNKFVRTDKFVDEQEKGKLLYASWTTLAPGGPISNIFGRKLESQAGVTVIERNGKLYAFDDGSYIYELDPDTLETKGKTQLGLNKSKIPVNFMAHSKIDGQTEEWILVSGLKDKLNITTVDKNDNLVKFQKVKIPKNSYIHDFFVSDNHIILNFQPAEPYVFKFMSGLSSFLESLYWRPKQGNILLVLNRNEEGEVEPYQFSVESSWMWHTLNAYEEGNKIVADFVGYRYPEQIFGDDPTFYAIMEGREKKSDYPGEIRRYIIDLDKETVQQQVLDGANYEYPVVNQYHSCRKHKYGYFVRAHKPEDVFWSSVVRMDMDTGLPEFYDFGKGYYCTEPVFVPKPGYNYSSDINDEPGWILTEVYDSYLKKSFLAILQADNLESGPVAKVHLKHHVPLSFHGFWKSSQ